MVLGFTKDEEKRHAQFVRNERPNLLPVLINEGITKQDCFDLIIKNKIDLPEIYKLGFPNASCIGCVKATSPTYWNLVREKFPDIFKERADMALKYGAKLVRVNKVRIQLHDLDPNAKGRSLKNYRIDCGIFCEEEW